MAQGTYAPDVDLRVVDTNGVPVSGGLVWTYLAGLSTPVATYTDVLLTVQNTNPIVADSSGRFVAFLTPGISYKFVYEQAATPPAHGAVIITRDNILGIPLAAGNVDLTGTAGETLSAGKAVYLSDGSGGKNAGQWYLGDSTNTYGSTRPSVGMVLSAISSGSTGTIRVSGQVTGLTVVPGSDYFLSTSGAISTVAATNMRLLGHADSATSLVLAANPRPYEPINISVCQGRLTLTSGLAVTTADVTAATTLYFTPYGGNQIALYDGGAGSGWQIFNFSELSIAIPATTSQMYDVWVYNNSGTLTLELLAWTNDTTRATALTTQNGILVKTGATTRRWLGSVRTTTVSGQTEDSAANRFLSNYYNRMRRPLQKFSASTTWNYTVATVREAEGGTANQVSAIVGFAEMELDLALNAAAANGGAATPVSVGIGEDSTTTYVVGCYITLDANNKALSTRLVKYPAVGKHTYSYNEWSTATGTSAWLGAVAAGGSTITNGLSGWIEG